MLVCLNSLRTHERIPVPHDLHYFNIKQLWRNTKIHCVSEKTWWNGRAIATFQNLYVSHGSTTRFFRTSEKYVICFIDNLLLFLTVKEFSKSVNS